ncbi:MAG: hypothetical protein ABR577_14025 [Pyrinomonadaceae bacterium]
MRTVVCPCCGFKFEGDLYTGCAACGARAVGEPLARPAVELPSYIPALFVGATGAVMLFAFTVSTAAALFESGTRSTLNFWSIISAAETAAWRLKWYALPAALVSMWAGASICALVRTSPLRFGGKRIAYAGLASSLVLVLMTAVLIGVTVPERLRQRELGTAAAARVPLWTLNRALLEYRRLHGTFPTRDIYALHSLPDMDGSIAAALDVVDTGGYKPTSLQASLPKKRNSLRGTMLRNASVSGTSDLPDEGLSFTNYELTLPGADKVIGTPDDVTMRDGILIETPPPFQQISSPISSRDARAP